MNQLAEQLNIADQICTEAYRHFDAADGIREEAEIKKFKGRQARKIIAVVASIFVLGIVVGLLDAMHIDNPLIPIALTVALGVCLHKFILMPSVNSAYNASMAAADAEDNTGSKILQSNSSFLSFLPADYWYPIATSYMLKIVQTGRAENVNQALQMFDEQLHRWKVEEANETILAQQQAQSEELKSIRKSSSINAAANVANAIHNISRL